MNLRRVSVLLAIAATAAAGACGSGAEDSPAIAQPGQAQATSPSTAATTTSPPAAASGSWKPGQYQGAITGGYQGDEISFTVGDGGKTVSDIVFTGNWKCTDGTKLMDVGHVPDPFTVNADGAWGGEQNAPYLKWTVTGAPDGSGGGKGTIRIEYDTECDTYQLNWTATRR